MNDKEKFYQLYDVFKMINSEVLLKDLPTNYFQLLDKYDCVVMIYEKGERCAILNDYGKKILSLFKEIQKIKKK